MSELLINLKLIEFKQNIEKIFIDTCSMFKKRAINVNDIVFLKNFGFKEITKKNISKFLLDYKSSKENILEICKNNLSLRYNKEKKVFAKRKIDSKKNIDYKLIERLNRVKIKLKLCKTKKEKDKLEEELNLIINNLSKIS